MKKLISNQDLLKFIALIVMMIDHSGAFILQDMPYLRAIGRVGIPIWFFFVGYNFKINYKNDYIILASFLILHIAICTLTGSYKIHPNVLLTMFLARMCLRFIKFDCNNYNFAALSFLSLITYPFTNIAFEYGGLGILIAIWGYNIKKNIGDRKFQSIIIYALLCITQLFSFGFDIIDQTLVVTSFALIIYYLHNFTPSNFEVIGGNIISYASHTTLYSYCITVFLFNVSKKLIG